MSKLAILISGAAISMGLAAQTQSQAPTSPTTGANTTGTSKEGSRPGNGATHPRTTPEATSPTTGANTTGTSKEGARPGSATTHPGTTPEATSPTTGANTTGTNTTGATTYGQKGQGATSGDSKASPARRSMPRTASAWVQMLFGGSLSIVAGIVLRRRKDASAVRSA